MKAFKLFLKEKNLKITGTLKGKKFLVDPGHGGHDPGAMANGLIERDINLPMAFDLGSALKSLGGTVAYTRTDNETYKTLKQRGQEAVYYDVDFCFSQHNNAGGGDGFEAIHSICTDASEGDEMAKSIAAAVEKYSHQNVRRVFSKSNTSNKDYYAMHRYTQHVPTVILEGGFLDGDIEDINTREKRQEIAFAEALGVAEYYGIVEKRDDTNEAIESIDLIISALKELKKQL